jgi:hypothetical protein
MNHILATESGINATEVKFESLDLAAATARIPLVPPITNDRHVEEKFEIDVRWFVPLSGATARHP